MGRSGVNSMAPAEKQTSPRKAGTARRLRSSAIPVLAGLLLSGALLWLTIRGLDWAAVGAHLSGASVILLLLGLLMFLAASLVRAARWRLLFARDQPTLLRLFVVQNEGIGVNNMLPLRLASEVTQLAVLTVRDRVHGGVVAASLGMERVVDAGATALILGATIFLVPELRDFTPVALAGIAVSLAALFVVRGVLGRGQALAVVRRFTFISEFVRAVGELAAQPRRLAAAGAITFLYWGMVGLTAWVLAVALELPIDPLTTTLLIMGTIVFTTTVPGAPSGVGTFEFAVVYFLDFFGIERSEAFGYAVVIHVVLFLPPIFIAIIFLPREGILSFWEFARKVRGSGRLRRNRSVS